MNYNTLVLSGGSVRTICELGSIQYYNDTKRLADVDLIVSSSASSIIAYLLIIGYTPIEMLNIVCSHPLFTTDLPVLDMVSLLSRKGGMTFSTLRDLLETLTIDKVGQLMTIGKLYDLFKIRLVVATFNYDSKDMEFLSPDTTPDIPCITAIQMSCALPFIFQEYKYMGCRYIDPGVVEPIPLSYLETLDLTERKVLAIAIEPYLYEDPENSTELYPLFHNITFLPTRMLLRIHLSKLHKSIDVVDLNIETHFLNYYLNTKEKFDMFTFGYQRACVVDAPEAPVDQKGADSLVDSEEALDEPSCHEELDPVMEV